MEGHLILFVDEINPEPWRSPSLGTVRKGGRVLPVAYKDENLRGYQAAIHESVVNALREQDLPVPYFTKGTDLDVSFVFWRQLEDYQLEARRGRRKAADASNMTKSTEDALQGALYHNDRNNRRTAGEIAACGPDVSPGVLVTIKPFLPVYEDNTADLKSQLTNIAIADKSRTVWMRRANA